MKSCHLIIIALSLVIISCSKTQTKNHLTKTWSFSKTPTKNLNNYMGNVEDRTIFDGTETITFKADGKFLVNNVEHGSWSYNKKSSVISIDQIPYKEYSCCGTPQTKMEWKVLKIKKDELSVKHSYYKYPDNQYNLK